MDETGIAKIFMHGRSQAVRLPKEFRLPGDRVRVLRTDDGILLQPMLADVDEWLDELHRLTKGQFLPEGRPEQPPMPPDKDLWG